MYIVVLSYHIQLAEDYKISNERKDDMEVDQYLNTYNSFTGNRQNSSRNNTALTAASSDLQCLRLHIKYRL